MERGKPSTRQARDTHTAARIAGLGGWEICLYAFPSSSEARLCNMCVVLVFVCEGERVEVCVSVSEL